jgi:hypothetical protein
MPPNNVLPLDLTTYDPSSQPLVGGFDLFGHPSGGTS